MHSPLADNPTEQEIWLDELRTEALTRFANRIPKLYRNPVPLAPAAEQWAAGGRAHPGSLFITGPIGAGKTHTAWTAVTAWLSNSFNPALSGNPVVAIHRSTELFDALRPDADNARTVQRTAQEADLLFLDDLAAARVSPSGWTQERLYEIFDERYVQQRPVIITCDVLPKELEPVVGPRVASRLAEMCTGHVLFLGGTDRRRGGTA